MSRAVLHTRLIAIFALNCLALFTAAQLPPNKLALIIAISKYKPGTDWNDLASEKDVPLIREALIKQGFRTENIIVIRDQQATKEGILNGIQKHLIDKAKPGDICVFHFSGHGQQVYDDNGDEPDGYDEALVTYDSPMDYVPGAERHLRDDAFGTKLEELRMKLGETGELVVLIDACHSGTATRGGKFRGTAKKYQPNNYKVAATTTTQVNEKLFGLGDRKSGLAPMIAFFASSASQLNSQVTINGEDYGSLSMAFFRIVSNAPSQMSYKSIADQIRIQMRRWGLSQDPDAEGELDKEMFGGNLLLKSNYFLPSDVKGKQLSIKTGKTYNIWEGTTVKLYPPETRDTNAVQPLAVGKIIRAEDFSSVVEVRESIDESVLQNAWIYLDEINFGELVTALQLKNLTGDALGKFNRIINQIKEVKKSEQSADLTVEVSSEEGTPQYLFRHKNEIFLQVPVSMEESMLTDTLQYRLKHYAWSRYFMQLQKIDTNIRISFRMVPVKVTKRNERGAIAETQDLPESTIKNNNGSISFAAGDFYNLEISNNGHERAYYTLLEIQPDHRVGSLMPGFRLNDEPKSYFMEPDQTIRNPRVFRIGPPYGKNRLLLIASREPLDYRPFLSKPERNKVKTRGSADEGGVEMDVMNTFYIDFEIVQKK